MNDIPNDVKIAIATQERDGTLQQIYRMTFSVMMRRRSGYTEAECAPLITEGERLMRMADAINAELALLIAAAK